jgi:hypothetical protein
MDRNKNMLQETIGQLYYLLIFLIRGNSVFDIRKTDCLVNTVPVVWRACRQHFEALMCFVDPSLKRLFLSV